MESHKGKVTACENKVHTNSISRRIFQHCATRDCTAFTTQQPPTSDK
jgi:hypothetical protein